MTLINGSIYNLSLLQRKRFQTRSSLNFNNNFKNKRNNSFSLGSDYCFNGFSLIDLIKRK